MDIHIAVGLDGRLAANVCLNLRLDGRYGVSDSDLDASAAGDRGGGIRLRAADGSDHEVAVDDRIDTLTQVRARGRRAPGVGFVCPDRNQPTGAHHNLRRCRCADRLGLDRHFVRAGDVHLIADIGNCGSGRPGNGFCICDPDAAATAADGIGHRELGRLGIDAYISGRVDRGSLRRRERRGAFGAEMCRNMAVEIRFGIARCDTDHTDPHGGHHAGGGAGARGPDGQVPRGDLTPFVDKCRCGRRIGSRPYIGDRIEHRYPNQAAGTSSGGGVGGRCRVGPDERGATDGVDRCLASDKRLDVTGDLRRRSGHGRPHDTDTAR